MASTIICEICYLLLVPLLLVSKYALSVGGLLSGCGEGSSSDFPLTFALLLSSQDHTKIKRAEPLQGSRYDSFFFCVVIIVFGCCLLERFVLRQCRHRAIQRFAPRPSGFGLRYHRIDHCHYHFCYYGPCCCSLSHNHS